MEQRFVAVPSATAMGPVRLNAAEIDVMARFYRRAIGLRDLGGSDDVLVLGAGASALVELVDAPSAPAPAPRSTGLFHLAILVSGRPELARAIRRALDAGASFSGASDHLVSEALYLDDPEGNGIEIYRDRDRTEWRRDADGRLAMATLPLDVEAVLAALPARAGADGGMPEGTSMGHVHLRVRDVGEAEAFYAGLLGFDVTVRGYPGALFVSAGGYHHHLGLNTWASRGGPSPPPGSRGLERFTIVVPPGTDLDGLARVLDEAGALRGRDDGAVHATDPSGNRLVLRG